MNEGPFGLVLIPGNSVRFAEATQTNHHSGLTCRTRIGLAMSQDGRNWARIEANHHSGALFDAGGDGEWDAVLNGAPQVSLSKIKC